MRTETYEIVMHEKCRAMTEEETEYWGGRLDFAASVVRPTSVTVADHAGDVRLASKRGVRTTSSVMNECKASGVIDGASYSYTGVRYAGLEW